MSWTGSSHPRQATGRATDWGGLTMLHSAVMQLESLEARPLPPPNGYHVNALLLTLLRSANPALASSLHSDDGPKPYTTSVMRGQTRRNREDADARSSRPATLRLRFTFLDDEPFASLLDAVLRLSPEQTVELGEGRYRCALLATTPAQSPWARSATFESLLEGAPQDPVVSLRFMSLTTFRSGGRRNVLFPEPALTFGSLLSRWNAFSPVRLDACIYRNVFQRMQPVYYRLHTGAMGFGSYEELGFKGTCAYAMDRSEPQDVRQGVHALAAFSLFGGVGAKTTMGMGQCRRISDAGAVPGGARSDAPQRG